MFEDVHNEFCSLEIIKERFEKWKSTDSASYSQAFVGLCLPKLFAPFVRLQMLDWNPLEVRVPGCRIRIRVVRRLIGCCFW